MNAVRGRVRGAHVEIDAPLPHGAEVVVIVAAAGDQEPFDLDEASIAELERRIAGADHGQVEPADALYERLRPHR